MYLNESVVVDAHRRAVVLPKVCSWHLADFSTKKDGSAPLPADCLRVISSYLRGAARTSLFRMLGDGNNPSVRFRSFNFRCRSFGKLNDSYPTKILEGTGETNVVKNEAKQN